MKNLIQGCRNLDRRAQRQMVDHLSPFLYRICRRYTDCHDDAKDLLQESLILIFNNMEKCSAREMSSFKAWCRRIAINTSLGRIRKKQLPTESLNGTAYVQVSLPNIHGKLNTDDILKIIQTLPPNQRNVFNLAVIDGYSHQEIAKLLNIAESSSRTFLMRARKTLQHLIQQQEID